MTTDTIAKMLATLSDEELRAELRRRELAKAPEPFGPQTAISGGFMVQVGQQVGQWSVGPSFMREKRS